MNHKPFLNKLSVIIPAKNEGSAIRDTIDQLHCELLAHSIPHEILVVVDSITETTWETLLDMQHTIADLQPLHNKGLGGFGRAVIHGLNHMTGDAVVIMMADGSDDSSDVVRYWEELNKGYDCVFGSRFIKGGRIVNYPLQKRILNRMANFFIMILFGIRFNDTTNAFKAYRQEVIVGCRPFMSHHFELTVELPLKAIVRGFGWKVIPINWHNRGNGLSNLKIKAMGIRYLSTCISILREKYLPRST